MRYQTPVRLVLPKGSVYTEQGLKLYLDSIHMFFPHNSHALLQPIMVIMITIIIVIIIN